MQHFCLISLTVRKGIMLPVLPCKHSRRIILVGKRKSIENLFVPAFCWRLHFIPRVVTPALKSAWCQRRGRSQVKVWEWKREGFCYFRWCLGASCAQGLSPGCLTQGECGYWCKGRNGAQKPGSRGCKIFLGRLDQCQRKWLQHRELSSSMSNWWKKGKKRNTRKVFLLWFPKENIQGCNLHSRKWNLSNTSLSLTFNWEIRLFIQLPNKHKTWQINLSFWNNWLSQGRKLRSPTAAWQICFPLSFWRSQNPELLD